VGKDNFSTSIVLAKLLQLPLSMMMRMDRLHNTLRMEQSVSLILLSWGNLRTKNTLHNKTLVPIGAPRIDMYVCLSCIVSGKQCMFKFF
jgi:hypothetical protein